MSSTRTIRLYGHDECRARIEDSSAEVEAHGWDFCAGAVVRVDGVSYTLVTVGSRIQTDVRGDYVAATARPTRR